MFIFHLGICVDDGGPPSFLSESSLKSLELVGRYTATAHMYYATLAFSVIFSRKPGYGSVGWPGFQGSNG